jgi:hypothetical protein
MHATDIVGYTYNADTYCPSCTERIADERLLQIAPTVDPGLDVLGTWARELGIDREDERSYDSGDFPKVVFADMVEDDEYCGSCQNRLV